MAAGGAIVEAGGRRVFVQHVVRTGATRGTILFVNGAVATIASLRWAVKELTDFNLVLFDFPQFGGSAAHNRGDELLTKEAEAAVILDLIAHYRPDFLAAQSWGGAGAMLALAQSAGSVRRVVLASFSAGLTPVLRETVGEIAAALASPEPELAARITVERLGERLPDAARRLNERYLLKFDPDDQARTLRQLDYVAAMDWSGDMARFGRVDMPVLFINGAADRFTPPGSVRPFASILADPRFVAIPGAGHFLAQESPTACGAVVRVLSGFFGTAEAPVGALRRVG
ncbi:MAG: alpha/beta fold hydrolase [Caulobacterales bacterium]